ncbi:MAG: nickel-dependent lactate racemase [Thermoplasmatota archaeon]
MELGVQYGSGTVSSPYLKGAHVLKRMDGDTSQIDPFELYQNLFEEAYGIEALKDLASEKVNIGIILNDRNRPTPSHLVIKHLIGVEGMRDRIKKVHIATGTHKEPTETDIRTILGEYYEALWKKVHVHVAKDREGHVPYGVTRMGTELFFDRELEGHDLYIFVNSVEPHYFAGFTGGRKSIIPGMAYFGTTEKNHSHSLSEGSRALGLEGNPVHEDMEDGARIFLEGKEHLSIQIVQAPGKVITDLKVGDLFTSFSRAVESAKTRFCIPVKKLYDIVVTVAREPMDRTLYQAQKAIENGKLALKDGGVLVLVSECSEGIGQSTFWDLLTMSSDPDEVLRRIDEGYVLGYHKAAKIVQLSKKATIMAVSSIDPGELRRGFIEGYSDLDRALERAIEITGSDPDILLIPDGTVTVPLLKEEHI